MTELRFRQIHLDFHTSEDIPSIGECFDRAQFRKGLIESCADSITLFSKCHHGYAYFTSAQTPMHPHLKFDLLSAQLEVCRELGIDAPIYQSAGYDERQARLHPEWLRLPAPNTAHDFLNTAAYHMLCFNTPYLEVLVKEVEEIMQRFDPPEIFMDISGVRACYCNSCLRSMRQQGLDPHDPMDVDRHAVAVYKKYCERIEQAVRKYDPQTRIYHNAGNVTRKMRSVSAYQTHFELESLPTGGWGYDHFPMSASYVRNLGKDYLGMTGKFHVSWGEFGGFKHPNALLYETSLSLAMGAKCSIGDQLHPSGAMNLSTCRLIGSAYREVQKKEPWCRGVKSVKEIGVLSSVSANPNRYMEDRNPLSDVGASRMLLEGKLLFDFLDTEADFSAYRVIIVPDCVVMDASLAQRLECYVAGGGKLLLSGTSGLRRDLSGFALDIGADFEGMNDYDCSYFKPSPRLKMVNGETEYIMYEKACNILPRHGTDELGQLYEPYFNRTPEHFCSHQHAPNSFTHRPAVTLSHGVAYVAWMVFRDYAQKGSLHLKELVLNLLDILLENDRTLRVGLPDCGVATLMLQESQNRAVCHLLFAHTSVRGKNVEIIEDIVPLYNVPLEIKLPCKPKRVYLAPEQEELDFAYEDGRVKCHVPRVYVHTMVVLDL